MGLTNHRDHCGCMYSAYTLKLKEMFSLQLSVHSTVLLHLEWHNFLGNVS